MNKHDMISVLAHQVKESHDFIKGITVTKINIKQHKSPPDEARLGNSGNLIIMLLDTKDAWPLFPYADVLEQRWTRSKEKDDTSPLTTDLPNAAGTRVTLARIKPEISPFDLLTLARKLCAIHFEQNPAEISLIMPGLEDALVARVAEAMVAALLAGNHAMPSLKSKPAPDKRLTAFHIHGINGKLDFSRTLATAEGNNLARYLTALPPNQLTPAHYLERITELAKEHGWNIHLFDTKTLRRQGAGAFLAVAQGSADDDACIVQLCYSPKNRGVNTKGGSEKATKKRLALIGKGICYDTGGNNLKPAKSMFGMHEDMEGSAVALGTLLALTRLKADFSVHCWLALAQNHIGPKAYKQNDVVTASNGTTIEVVHTDAEGRMILADTLAMASAEHPSLIIDYATLTGACVYALGTRYSGAFTNRPALIPDIIEAGRQSGERVWPFPTDADYDKELESDIADIKQCTLTGEADHILAARFLSRFVKDDTPWLHIDLAASNSKGGLAHIPTDITGFGVRFTLDLLLDKGVLGKG